MKTETYRILIIDDNQSIHHDIAKVLTRPALGSLQALEKTIELEVEQAEPAMAEFELDSAFQGEEGVAKVSRACEENRPYAVAFVDMRMPPGIDGLETISQLWSLDPELQIVVCTAFSDYSWEQIAATTGPNNRVVVLRKPFEPIEVRQLAHTLGEKWRLERLARKQVADLEHLVAERTKELVDNQAIFHLFVEEIVETRKPRR